MWYLEDWNTAYTMSEKGSWSRVPLIWNTSAASATREGRKREREGRRVQRRERRGGEEKEGRKERGGRKIGQYTTCASQLGFSHAQHICLPLTDERVHLGGGSIGLGQCAVTDQLRLDK